MPPPRETLADAAVRALQTESARLAGARVAFLGNPGGVEPLHDLRISLRRLRAALLLFERVVLLPDGPNQRAFRPIGRRLAPIRDRDVALGLLHSMESMAADPERLALAGFGQAIETERAAAADQGLLFLLSERTLASLRRLERWVSAPRFTPAGAERVEAALPWLITPVLRDLAVHPGWWLPVTSAHGRLTAPGADDEACGRLLHELRRRARRARYLLEVAAASAPLCWNDAGQLAHAGRIHYFHRVQDSLGALQDVRVAERLLGGRFGGGWRELLPVTAMNLADRRGEGWVTWERERKTGA